MRLTTRSSYGVRALVNIVLGRDPAHPVSLKDISREEGISCVYLEQIFSRLKKSGVVKSVRGPKGGYVLAKDPASLTVLEVARAVEDGSAAERCLCGKTACERAATCAPRRVWEEAADGTATALGKYSILQLAEKTKATVAGNR